MQALKQQLNAGNIASVYVFYGEERLLINQTISQIKQQLLPAGLEDFNFEMIPGDKVSTRQIVDLANAMPFMAEKRIVLIDEPAMLQTTGKSSGDANGDEALFAYLDDPNPHSCVIFKCGEKVDKRKKVFKKLQEKATVVEFAPLKGKEMERWIVQYVGKSGKNIDGQSVAYLTAMSSYTLEILEKELDKAVLFCGDHPTITLAVVEAVVTKTVDSNVFQLIDSIGNKQGKKAIGLLQDTLYLGEAPLKIIALLVRHFRLLIMMKDLKSKGYNEQDIKNKLKLHPFVVTKGLKQGSKFQTIQLIQCLEALLQAEVALKSTTTYGDEVLERLIIDLCYTA